MEGTIVRRRLVVGAGGVAALALSISLALLGRAVLATPAAVAREAPGRPAAVHVGARHPSLADRAAWHLLAADRVEPFAEVVRTYRSATAMLALAGQPTWSIRIARLIPKLHAPEERAQAYVMAGTLLAIAAGDGLGVPYNNSTGARALLTQALDDFRAAVQADATNENAKYDLELLLRQEVARAPRRRPDSTKGKRTARPETSGGKSRQKLPVTQSQINDAGVYATGSGY
jgi:hypothetical protein